MTVCPSCATELPEGSRFCLSCGARLAAPAAAAEERKVVTTLFCDLVASTAMSESADPEDVDALLRRYDAVARRVVESHGGTVEKFIGDAVVAVFGVPAVHEDDPERAVRAGLRIVQALEGMMRPDGSPLQVRIGVNTGEALVRLDVTPGSGEGFLTGDAVNVAARLQAAARPGVVVAGALTHELTAKLFDYAELAPASLKGKAVPVRLWQAKAPLARTGTAAARDFLTPLMGRQPELARLQELFAETVASSASQCALVAGEPGVGKSRLVAELFSSIDALPELVTWRQGRCLPYGENVSFWALAEIVKAQAGVLDSDDRRVAAEKLEQAIPAGPDHTWLAERLRPLLGLEASQATREENFAAWRRFLAQLAAGGPAVLVFEDLHWADDGMLEFLEHLAGQAAGAPLLIVATTRPVLFERHSDYLSSVPITRLDLAPLSDEDTQRLVAALLKTEALPPAVSAPILERCAGNPLYAEEFTALLRERGLLIESAGGLALAEGDGLPLPGTVQAVIAARLDDLPAESKALLADAAVIGQTFWAGAVATLGEREAEHAERILGGLAGSALIRPAQTSTMAGEREYSFGHVLARDVAYGELPRAARARKHAAFATWLEAKAGERAGDLADVLAHHYMIALELAEVLRDVPLRESLIAPSLRYLGLAGARAMDLDVAAAERHFARALELAPADGAERPRLLAQWAIAVHNGGRHGESVTALEAAIDKLRAAGERRHAAEAMVYLARALERLGRPEAQTANLEAVALLEDDEPCRELVFALHTAAIGEGNLGRPERARQLAERALASAELLGLSARGGDAQASGYYRGALMARGSARCQLGDVGGLDDMREASEAAAAQGLDPILVANYAITTYAVKGPAAAVPICEQCLGLCRDRGLLYLEVAMRAALLEAQCDGGAWDEVLATSSELMDMLEAAEDICTLVEAQVSLRVLRARRGEIDPALPPIEWSLERARDLRMPVLLSCVLVAAATAYALADRPAARELLEELPDILDSSFAYYKVCDLPQMLRTAHLVGDFELAERLTVWIEPRLPGQRCARTYGDALLAEARGEHEMAAAGFADAAVGWRGFGVSYEEGHALLAQGRCLLALGRAPEAAAPLAAAREIFARLGAKPALADADAVLAAAGVSLEVGR